MLLLYIIAALAVATVGYVILVQHIAYKNDVLRGE